MDIPGLGRVSKDEQLDWYCSEPLPVNVLGGQSCRFVVVGYDDDPKKEEFHTAIRDFLSIGESVLKEVEGHIFQYYKDCIEAWGPEEDEYEPISSATDVWQQIQLGDQPLVTRREYGDRGIYVSLSCGCDWEEEHGLQIVFKNGQRVNKIGPYDGHYTNSDAYANERLEDVVYRQS